MTGRSARFPGAWAALVALAVLAPARSPGQQIGLDVNADGVTDGRDMLDASVRSVDVYLATDRSGDGAPTSCPQDSAQALTMLGYSVILRAWGDGEVKFQSWIPGPAVSAFTQQIGTYARGQDYYVAYMGLSPLPPGRYRLGTLLIQVTGHPRLSFVTSTDLHPGLLTAFASPCPGEDFENAIRLGHDFLDASGTAPGPPRAETAWEAIRLLYR